MWHFETTWVIDAPIHRLFDALRDYERWPEWWPGAERMEELAPLGPEGIGGRGRYVWRSRGYRLRFEGTATAVRRPHLLAGTVEGDLVGAGTWRLVQPDPRGPTTITYTWDVRAQRRWLRLLGPVLGPLLRRNHDRLMRDGGQALASWVAMR
ncbi:MAG: hypothetical protein JWM98_1598 [Thermoleophilia bacterium]|nr:hypothetical protein [Thermoleophilia bacterium]